MGKPVNAMTGDAPDGQNPDKKFVPPAPEGKWKYTPPPPTKIKPKDEGIFTEEMLRRSGGKMKEPPFDPEGKKRGGSIKRRFADGGDIPDYAGALGEGADTPDQAAARRKARTESSNKAAGLAASNKEEPVGFFKRLSMGNIDKPGSEAYEKLGAGRAKAESSKVDRNQQQNANIREANMALDANKPAPVTEPKKQEKIAPEDSSSDVENSFGTLSSVEPVKPVAKQKRIITTDQLTKAGFTGPEALRDFLNKEQNLSRRPNKSALKDPTTGEAKEGTAAQLAADKMRDVVPTKAPVTNVAFAPVKASTMVKSPYSFYPPENEKEKKQKAFREAMDAATNKVTSSGFKRGGATKAYAQGGSVSASSRGDGCAQRGKTRGMMR